MFPFFSAPTRCASYVFPLLSLLALSAPLMAAPMTTVQVVAGQDRWSQAVARDWPSRTQAVLASASALLRDHYEIDPGPLRQWVIAASPTDRVDAPAARIVLEAGLSEAELRERALLYPSRVLMYQAFERLSAGNLDRLPPWLLSALADTLAQDALCALHLPPAPELEAEIPVWDMGKVAQHQPAPAGSMARVVARPSPKSRIAMAILRQRLGDGFHQAVKSYLLASARSDFNQPAAFSNCFGISEHELAGLEQRQRDTRALQPGYAQAVGDVSPHIHVRMGGYVQDAFAASIEQNSLPLVRQATLRFDELVHDLWHVQLEHDVTVYLAAGPQDYQQVLAQDMHTKAEVAEVESEVSGGMSNRRGQIAIKFDSKGNLNKLNERAVRTTMHELTHQIQYQLAEGKSAFRPPHWMMEGPAKLIEYLFSEQMLFDGSEPERAYAWRQTSLKWWRTGNRTGLTPEDLVNAGTGPDWLKMMKEHRGNYEMATLMMMYLKAVSGESFFSELANYYRLSGHAGQNHQLAFKTSFGVSESDFVADFKLWLMKQ